MARLQATKDAAWVQVKRAPASSQHLRPFLARFGAYDLCRTTTAPPEPPAKPAEPAEPAELPDDQPDVLSSVPRPLLRPPDAPDGLRDPCDRCVSVGALARPHPPPFQWRAGAPGLPARTDTDALVHAALEAPPAALELGGLAVLANAALDTPLPADLLPSLARDLRRWARWREDERAAALDRGFEAAYNDAISAPHDTARTRALRQELRYAKASDAEALRASLRGWSARPATPEAWHALVLAAAAAVPCWHAVDPPRRCARCGGETAVRPDPAPTFMRRPYALVYGPERATPALVFSRECVACGTEAPYDGHAHGLVNCSNATLLTESVLAPPLDTFWFERSSGVAQWKRLEQAYVRAGSGRFVGKTTFSQALYGYLRLLRADFPEGFMCPFCRHLPPCAVTLAFDGIMLGHRDELGGGEIPADDADPEDPDPDDLAADPADPAPTAPRYRLHDFRVVPVWAHYALLKRYAKAGGDGVTDAEWRQLLVVPGVGPSPLAGLLEYCDAQPDARVRGGRRRCPDQALRDFLACAAAPSPAVGSFLVPPPRPTPDGESPVAHLARLLDALEDARELDPALAEAVGRAFPALGRLVGAGGHPWPRLRAPLAGLLRRLRDICAALTVGAAHAEPPPDPVDEDAYSPMFPPIRKAKTYHGRPRPVCRKFATATGISSPGLVIGYCPHGLAVMFTMLRRFEGPTVIFDLLYRRFPEPPRMVVYDNGCSLHAVCMAREPAFFAPSCNKIDRMHFCGGHTGCSKGYSLDDCPAYEVISEADVARARAAAHAAGVPFPAGARPITADEYNSQVCEQYNSRLRGIETSCRHMKRETFFAYVRLFMFRVNVERIAGLLGMTNDTALLRRWGAPSAAAAADPETARRRVPRAKPRAVTALARGTTRERELLEAMQAEADEAAARKRQARAASV